MDAGELELIRRARDGEPEALARLVEVHAPHLFRIAYALCGRVADAEDLVQETLVAAIGSFKRFEGRSSLKTWLVAILARQAAYARRRKKPETGQALEGVPTASASRWADARMDLAGALANLSPEHREVLVLREIEGMSYDEIAAALGVPRGTVESRLFRARQELRVGLKDYQEGV